MPLAHAAVARNINIVVVAANFSRGLPWTRIDNECKLRGF